MSDSFTSNRNLERTILGPDPRLSTRMAVRGVLGTQDIAPSDALLARFQEWPQMVEAVLEDERSRYPEAVASIRDALGLPESPYVQGGLDLVREFSRCGDSAERLYFAATMLQGVLPVLSAQVVALGVTEGAESLLTALYEVAPDGNRRAQLGKIIAQLENVPQPPFALNRQSNAFHEGCLVDDNLVMIFREYPGHYTLFSLRLGAGVEHVTIRPVSGEKWIEGVLQHRHPEHIEARSLDDCRTLVAGAICRLEDGEPAIDWSILGHLVEERLFPIDKNGLKPNEVFFF